MSTPTPIYNIPSPSPNTKFKDLGAELLAYTSQLEALLASFDYNGADPNLVLSRVVALETGLAELETVVDGISVSITQSGTVSSSTSSGSLGIINGTNVTFDTPFADYPSIDGYPEGLSSCRIEIYNVTPYGFAYRWRNLASSAQPPGSWRWVATGLPA